MHTYPQTHTYTRINTQTTLAHLCCARSTASSVRWCTKQGKHIGHMRAHTRTQANVHTNTHAYTKRIDRQIQQSYTYTRACYACRREEYAFILFRFILFMLLVFRYLCANFVFPFLKSSAHQPVAADVPVTVVSSLQQL